MSGKVFVIQSGNYHIRPWDSTLLDWLENSFDWAKKASTAPAGLINAASDGACCKLNENSETHLLTCSDSVYDEIAQKIVNGQIPLLHSE